MISYEASNPICQIELYRDISYYRPGYARKGIFIYITGRSNSDYNDRYIEFNYFALKDGISIKYNLVLFYNTYSWLDKDPQKKVWKLISKNDEAYNFLRQEIESFRK
jgi:hypothetical protein